MSLFNYFSICETYCTLSGVCDSHYATHSIGKNLIDYNQSTF